MGGPPRRPEKSSANAEKARQTAEKAGFARVLLVRGRGFHGRRRRRSPLAALVPARAFLALGRVRGGVRARAGAARLAFRPVATAATAAAALAGGIGPFGACRSLDRNTGSGLPRRARRTR